MRTKTQVVKEKVSGMAGGMGSKIGNVGARVKGATQNATSKLFTKNINQDEQKKRVSPVLFFIF